MDSDPAVSEELKRRFGITPHYYVAPAPDPNPQQFAEACRVLSELVGREVSFPAQE